jgi:inorganic triphosphatase YgiF
VSVIERELKLMPDHAGLLTRLADVSSLGAFVVAGKHREVQHNSFFDTPSRALSHARLGFRRRTIDGQSRAWWTLKSDAEVVRGVATRSEIELQLEAHMPPALALGALRQAAAQRGARTLAEEVSDALASGGLPLATPFLESSTDRTILDLEAPAQGWQVELALDRVDLDGHHYAEFEIEAELKRGDEAALDAIRAALEAAGPVRESEGSKLSRALDHLNACTCPRS